MAQMFLILFVFFNVLSAFKNYIIYKIEREDKKCGINFIISHNYN
jgi:hypothetical protein